MKQEERFQIMVLQWVKQFVLHQIINIHGHHIKIINTKKLKKLIYVNSSVLVNTLKDNNIHGPIVVKVWYSL